MSATTELEGLLQDLAQGGDVVLEKVAQLNAGALDETGLDEQTAVLARFGALVALDASPSSYLVHLILAEAAGIPATTVRAVLVTLAPLVGSARVVSASDNILQAIRLADST
jgi:alkylhydroperoxidase/carboxymuconolactone decarboxylase family protein YurZ